MEWSDGRVLDPNSFGISNLMISCDGGKVEKHMVLRLVIILRDD